MTHTMNGQQPENTGKPLVSPVRLALVLGAGLLALVMLLSLLAPEELPVDLERLQILVDEGLVISVAVGDGSLVAQLREQVALDLAGQRYRTDAVVVAGPVDQMLRDRVADWSATGVAVVRVDDPPGRSLRDAAWIGFVLLLLSMGVYHLVTQARTHRRDGSPRQRLDEAQADRDAGRITAEEYERRASAITIEM